MFLRVTWAGLALALLIVAFCGETAADMSTAQKIPLTNSLAPATPSQPVAPAQPAAPSQQTEPATIPVVAASPRPSSTPTSQPATKLDIDYFCQTVSAEGDHRTKYVSGVFASFATTQSLTSAWLEYLQARYHVTRAASGGCARVAKGYETSIPDREKQWQAMSYNVVHVDWKG